MTYVVFYSRKFFILHTSITQLDILFFSEGPMSGRRLFKLK